MAKCKHETKNGRCGLKESYAYRHKCFTEDLCKCHEPMTNADRIRAMSDEELAEWLGEHLDCINCPVGVTCVHGNGCPGSLVDWLKQPAE